MKPYLNPFAPGAGMPPPELAGRDSLLSEAKYAIKRNILGNSARSFIYVGLRGVGKTVLLNEIQAMADEEGAITNFIEVSNNDSLSWVMIATMRAALLKLDRMRNISDKLLQ
jgi:Cdc6-like AAA superfamily ATPase